MKDIKKYIGVHFGIHCKTQEQTKEVISLFPSSYCDKEFNWYTTFKGDTCLCLDDSERMRVSSLPFVQNNTNLKILTAAEFVGLFSESKPGEHVNTPVEVLFTENKLGVFERAIKQNGILNQLDMVIEECAELTQAINKARRAGIVTDDCIMKPNAFMSQKQIFAYHNLCGEVADVMIMLPQIQAMLDAEFVKIAYDRKIQRLERRLLDGTA